MYFTRSIDQAPIVLCLRIMTRRYDAVYTRPHGQHAFPVFLFSLCQSELLQHLCWVSLQLLPLFFSLFSFQYFWRCTLFSTPHNLHKTAFALLFFFSENQLASLSVFTQIKSQQSPFFSPVVQILLSSCLYYPHSLSWSSVFTLCHMTFLTIQTHSW